MSEKCTFFLTLCWCNVLIYYLHKIQWCVVLIVQLSNTTIVYPLMYFFFLHRFTGFARVWRVVVTFPGRADVRLAYRKRRYTSWSGGQLSRKRSLRKGMYRAWPNTGTLMPLPNAWGKLNPLVRKVDWYNKVFFWILYNYWRHVCLISSVKCCGLYLRLTSPKILKILIWGVFQKHISACKSEIFSIVWKLYLSVLG